MSAEDNGGLPRWAGDLVGWVEHNGLDAGEALWLAALGMIEAAVAARRERVGGGWRLYSKGELRRLRHDMAAALLLARLAAELDAADRGMVEDLQAEARAAVEAEGVRRRRAQTLPAERARRANAAARKAAKRQ